MSEWISVKDCSPDLDMYVLGCNQFNEIRACYKCRPWADKEPIWYTEGLFLFYPTHWMPLTEPPKDSE